MKLKFKSSVSAAYIHVSFDDFEDAASNIVGNNHFEFNEKRERDCLEVISTLWDKGQILHMLVALQDCRKKLSWFRHRKFLGTVRALEAQLSIELFERKLTKRELHELRTTLEQADAYVKTTPIQSGDKGPKRESVSKGPEKCQAVADLYHRLAKVSSREDMRRSKTMPFRGNWFVRKLQGLKDWFSRLKAEDPVIFTRKGLKNSFNRLKAKDRAIFTRESTYRGSDTVNSLYQTAARYTEQTAEPNNVLLKAKLIKLNVAAKNYTTACNLMLELLPEHTHFAGVDVCKKNTVTGESYVTKTPLSLINELSTILVSATQENRTKALHNMLLFDILSNAHAVDRLKALSEDANHGGANLDSDEMTKLQDLLAQLATHQDHLESKRAKSALRYATHSHSARSTRSSPIVDKKKAITRSATVNFQRGDDGNYAVALHM